MRLIQRILHQTSFSRSSNRRRNTHLIVTAHQNVRSTGRVASSFSENRILRSFSSWDDHEDDVTIHQASQQQEQQQQQKRPYQYQRQQRSHQKLSSQFQRQEFNRPRFNSQEQERQQNYNDNDSNNQPSWDRTNRPSLEPPKSRSERWGEYRNDTPRESSSSSRQPRRVKPWNDTERSLAARVKALSQASTVHPADISSPLVPGQKGSAMERLLDECCGRGGRNATLESMTWAETVMERLLLEKEKVNQQITAGEGSINNQQKRGGRGPKNHTRYLVLPITLWDKFLLGWSNLIASSSSSSSKKNKDSSAPQHPIPVPHILDRMFEGLQQALQHASMDDAHDHDLTQRYQEHPLHTSRPNRQFLNLYLRALAVALPQEQDPYKLDDYLEKAYNHLEQMHQLAQHKPWKTAPNIRSYMHVMQMIAHSRHPHAGSKALELLNHVQNDVWEDAKAKAVERWQKNKAEEQAREQARFQEKTGKDLSGFRTVALERSSQLESEGEVAGTTANNSTTATALEVATYSSYAALPSKIKQELPTPDEAFYTTCLMAMANSASTTRPEQVEELLDKALEQDDIFIVDGPMLAMAIRAVGNILDHEEDVMERVALAETAQRILGKVSGYWKELKRAQKQKARHGKPPYAVTEEDRRQAYNACLNVWSKAACRESARQAEALLFTMMNQRKTARKIVAKAKDEVKQDDHEDAQEEEDSDFDEDDDKDKMPRLGDYVETRPNVVSFNIVLNGWLRCHSSLAGVAPGKALELLKLQKAYGERDVNHDLLIGPDAQSYTLAILAQARRQKLQHALPEAKRLLQKWLDSTDPIQMRAQQKKKLGGKDHNPESLVAPFSAVLKVIHETPPNVAMNSAPKKGSDVKEEDDVWNSTVAAPPSSDNDNDDAPSTSFNPLYETALDIYQAVRMDTHQLGLQADHHFYTAFLACVNRHGGKGVEAQTMIQQVMEEACASGQVSRIVWPRLQTAAKELGGWDVLWTDGLDCSVEELESMETTSQLPRYWRRNVPFAWK